MDETSPEEEASVETFELFSQFDGSDRDHYADPKKSSFELDVCNHLINIRQDGSLQMGLGVTGARVWDASVVLAKYIEHNANLLGLKKPGTFKDHMQPPLQRI